MYNFYMEPIEIIYIVVMSALIFACLWSFILIAAYGGGKTVKIIFLVVSALSLAINIFLVIVWTGIIPFEQMGVLAELRTTIFAPILAFVLTVVSASEFAGLFLMSNKSKTTVIAPQQPVEVIAEECFIPDNERRVNECKHADYKIVDMGE